MFMLAFYQAKQGVQLIINDPVGGEKDEGEGKNEICFIPCAQMPWDDDLFESTDRVSDFSCTFGHVDIENTDVLTCSCKSDNVCCKLETFGGILMGTSSRHAPDFLNRSAGPAGSPN
jgi:hypothetical protein